jgi:hypothetical protein
LKRADRDEKTEKKAFQAEAFQMFHQGLKHPDQRRRTSVETSAGTTVVTSAEASVVRSV